MCYMLVNLARDVVLKDQIVILPKSTISHDIIHSYNIINTNTIISGVPINENCYIGAGSNIRDHVSILAVLVRLLLKI